MIIRNAQDMELKNFGVLIVGFIVAVLLVVAILMPIINASLTTAGDPVTYTNSGAGVAGSAQNAYYKITEDTTLEYIIDSGGIHISETDLTYSSSATWGPIVWTDAGSLDVRVSTYSVRLSTYDLENNASVTKTYTLPVTATIANGELMIVDGAGTEATLTFTEGYFVDIRANENEKRLFMAVDLTTRFGTFYLNSVDQVRCMGIYASGENDCYYSLSNGTLTNNGGFTNSIVATMTPVEGTTDIYHLESFKLDIGGEEFTPYFSIVPMEVDGHATSGAVYNTLSIIPLFMIVGILMGIVGAIFTRRV